MLKTSTRNNIAPKPNPGKENDINLDRNGRFIFRYKLDSTPETPDPNLALPDYFIKQLQELLNIVTLTYKNQDIKVDGFKFLNSDDTIHKIF